jgi:hypothetical protein
MSVNLGNTQLTSLSISYCHKIEALDIDEEDSQIALTAMAHLFMLLVNGKL